MILNIGQTFRGALVVILFYNWKIYLTPVLVYSHINFWYILQVIPLFLEKKRDKKK